MQTTDAVSEASSALMDQHGEQIVRCFELSRDWSWETAHLALTATGSLWCVNSLDCFCKTRSDVGLVDFTHARRLSAAVAFVHRLSPPVR